MFLTVLSDSDDNKLKGELLLSYLDFGIVLLDGGNPKVQDSVYHYCMNYPQSEIMFTKFYKIIQDQVERLGLE